MHFTILRWERPELADLLGTHLNVCESVSVDIVNVPKVMSLPIAHS